ncbi:MAG: DUF4258 domain-containing protein [Lacibacter sp.]
MKKALPYIFLIVLVLATLLLRRFTQHSTQTDREKAGANAQTITKEEEAKLISLFRTPDTKLYFSKHARCRMKCRSISQAEVREIIQKAQINKRKSDPAAAGGPRYALEGVSAADRQHIRVIVAPKQRHLTVVTVIDLDYDWECPSCQ